MNSKSKTKPENAKQVFAEARHAGMKMWVPKDKDTVKIDSPIPVRPEFKEAVRENKDEIMRHLLLRQASAYLKKRGLGDSVRALEIPMDYGRQVQDAYAEGTITELREALRAYVRAGLAEYKAARERNRRGL